MFLFSQKYFIACLLSFKTKKHIMFQDTTGELLHIASHRNIQLLDNLTLFIFRGGRSIDFENSSFTTLCPSLFDLSPPTAAAQASKLLNFVCTSLYARASPPIGTLWFEHVRAQLDSRSAHAPV